MQIKQLMSQKLNSSILCAVFLLYPVSFGTNVYCHVRGYIYYDGYDVSSLTRNDLCSMIESKVEGNKVILWSETYWVFIDIPESIRGHTTFWYKWGSDRAYINGTSYSVEWGYVLKS